MSVGVRRGGLRVATLALTAFAAAACSQSSRVGEDASGPALAKSNKAVAVMRLGAAGNSCDNVGAVARRTRGARVSPAHAGQGHQRALADRAAGGGGRVAARRISRGLLCLRQREGGQAARQRRSRHGAGAHQLRELFGDGGRGGQCRQVRFPRFSRRPERVRTAVPSDRDGGRLAARRAGALQAASGRRSTPRCARG